MIRLLVFVVVDGKIDTGEIVLFRLPYHYPSPRMIISYPAGKILNEEEQELVDMICSYVKHL